MATDEYLENAYQWLCTQRANRSHNNSVWDVRFNWVTIKPLLQQQLLSNCYTLSPLQSYIIEGDFISAWTATDAIVLKALSYIMQHVVTIAGFSHCTHIKGGGGIHRAIKMVALHKGQYQHVLKSDVYHFGETPSISKTSLENHRAKLARRYARNESPACIGAYIERWTSWRAGVMRCCRNEFLYINPQEPARRKSGTFGLFKEKCNENFNTAILVV